ncbi:MAG: lipoate--protein ligase family protein [Anaerolineaceae bacterium]|nr:lipoate--protein ligase family protein [Anaerolineaceae bacterium]
MTETEGRSFPAATWRLILDGEADGPTNMALDDAILEAVGAEASPPTLRFYGWSPPCLTLGRSQPQAEADLEACRAAGVHVVRRPSGGQAILHTDELTYSIALRQADPRAEGGVLEVYRLLSDGLLLGLNRLGVGAVSAAGKADAGVKTPICFETPSAYEIVANGLKLVGSAQWRARGAVLQHGTLPLQGDLGRIVHYLSFPETEREEQARRLLARATTLEAVLGCRLPFDQVADALAAGLAQVLNVTLAPGSFSAGEQARAAELRRTRYTDPEWTARR